MAGVHNMMHSGGMFAFIATISANTNNYNLRTAALAAGWTGVQPLYAQITINGGVVVGSTTTGTPAFDTGSAPPAGSVMSIINNGSIVGKGGDGGLASGAGSNYPTFVATAGGTGGDALKVQYATSVTNNGTIGGGGGGGGGSGGATVGTTTGFGGSGGGGAGANVGLGGSRTSAGSNGTLTTGGSGGNSGADGGPGGTGGAQGAAGAAGTPLNNPNAAGGSGGFCTSTGSNALITWVATGTRNGTLG